MLVAALPPNVLFIQLNILIDRNGNARLTDFGLLTIVSDHTNFTTSNSFTMHGTTRWMSPELLHAQQFGLKDVRPTKESDCYALGMVIYEVLSGRVPFTPLPTFIVMQRILEGERPGRPEGAGMLFTDDLWHKLVLCWETKPESRPSIEVVLECLQQVSRGWKPPPPQVYSSVEFFEDGLYHMMSTVSRPIPV